MFFQKISEKAYLKMRGRLKHVHDCILKTGSLAPPCPSGGPHFSMKRLIPVDASNPPSGHAQPMDLSELLEPSRPPDSALVDLIERAFLERQIDGQKADLASL